MTRGPFAVRRTRYNAGIETSAAVPVPPHLRELFETLFERVETFAGWNLTSGRQGWLEIVRDGSGYTVYGKGKFAMRDLEPPADDGSAA